LYIRSYILGSVYEWDERKRLANLAKHGIDFADMPRVFAGSIVVSTKARGGEVRHLAVTEHDGVFYSMVFTVRGDAIRIISARRSSREEREAYRSV
jgi:uncharacterized protein